MSDRVSPRLPLLVVGALIGIPVGCASIQQNQLGIAGPVVLEPLVPLLFDGRLDTLRVDPIPQRADSAADGATTAWFEGLPYLGHSPPDAVGAVGASLYVQMVNAKRGTAAITAVAVFDKRGRRLAGPVAFRDLWQAHEGECATGAGRDPIVLYDHFDDRWLISELALGAGLICLAISRTGDPISGGWFLYSVPAHKHVDYPKVAIWPIGVAIGATRRQFTPPKDVLLLERAAMLDGRPARAVAFVERSPSFMLMPAVIDGPEPDPTAAPIFVRQLDGDETGDNDAGRHGLDVFALTINWDSPENAVLRKTAFLSTTDFDTRLCRAGEPGRTACATQQDSRARLSVVTDALMWRLQYRDMGTHQALVGNHAIDVGDQDHIGIRWFELRRVADDPWTIFQYGDYAPDAAHRWMASVGMDRFGSIALAYSISGDDLNPGIRYAARRANDPVGEFTIGDEVLLDDAGPSNDSYWGDYTALTIDPTDDCTFWYTNQYVPNEPDSQWATRVFRFRVPPCTSHGDRSDSWRWKWIALIILGSTIVWLVMSRFKGWRTKGQQRTG